MFPLYDITFEIDRLDHDEPQKRSPIYDKGYSDGYHDRPFRNYWRRADQKEYMKGYRDGESARKIVEETVW